MITDDNASSNETMNVFFETEQDRDFSSDCMMLTASAAEFVNFFVFIHIVRITSHDRQIMSDASRKLTWIIIIHVFMSEQNS